MTSDSRSPVLAWLGLGLLLAASAAATLAFAKAGSLLFAWLGSPTVWQVLAGLIVAWAFTFTLPDKVGAPLRGVLQWWIAGTALAALALVIARQTNAAAEALHRWDAGWLSLKEKLGVVFAYDLLPALLVSGWLLSLTYAPQLSGVFRVGRRLLGGASIAFTILTAATSFSFFTVAGDYADRLGDVTVVARETEGKVAENLAREQLTKAMQDDPAAAAEALRALLQARLDCARKGPGCDASIGQLKAALKRVPPHDQRADKPLPEAFAHPPGTAADLRAQLSEQRRIEQQRADAAREETRSRTQLQEAIRGAVELVIGVLGGELVGLVDLANVREVIGELAESYFEACVQLLVGDAVVGNLAAFWQRLSEAVERALKPPGVRPEDVPKEVRERGRDVPRDTGLGPLIDERLREGDKTRVEPK
jgi:hypothetical protein